jgi:hypothetical protein
MDFILNNWAELALILITAAGSITALTESEKDDTIVDVLKRILNAVILGKSKK